MKHKKILLSEPNLIGNELKYIKECLSSNWLSSSGNFVKKFEKSISNYTKSKYSVSVINGTSALHLSLKILGIKPNDEVIVPSLTFIAPINAIIYNSASPIFMDSDDFFNIDVFKCIEFIKNETYFKSGYSYNKKTKKRIFAIICVHIWGNAVDLNSLFKICRKRNLKIIEDASESLGTRYKSGKFAKKHTGSIGDIGCLSFNGNKIITSGGGGMILTNNKKIAEKALYYSTQSKNDSIKYIHNDVGYNYRLSNIHSAIGLAQLENIEKFLKIKLNIFKLYKKYLNKIEGIDVCDRPKYSINNNWLNVVTINKKKYRSTVLDLIRKFSNKNIQVRPLWFLNHNQIMFKKYQRYYIDNANKLLNTSLCLPSSTNLVERDIKKIIEIFNE